MHSEQVFGGGGACMRAEGRWGGVVGGWGWAEGAGAGKGLWEAHAPGNSQPAGQRRTYRRAGG